ncbi:MAG: glycosyltransferase 87 family protein [Mycolicibacterium sp.]|uniref:glycosyltransferase 87 family protein n=1 Tax=Mycolicibacterium sp. TaxID=2320850 RepID=UPI003D0E5CC4
MVIQSIALFQLDLSVFRDAGGAFRRGLPLYSEDFPSSSGFRFIYPPFAAILFAPKSWLAPALLQVVWALLNIVLVWWVLRICLARLKVDRPSVAAVLLLGPTLLLEPIRSNFSFGQINIVLMALVVADCLRAVPRALRGAAIGLAAAIKLTPAGFALFLLARRDFKAIATAVGVFLTTVAVGFWLRPQDSTWFWTSEFFRDERAGGHEFHRNQAITGPLARFGLDGPAKDAIWLFAAIMVAVVAYWAARRFARNGEHVVAIGVVALAILLAAPIAVTHHWVYCVILVPLMVAPQYRSWRPFLASATAVFLIGPHVVLENTGSPPAWHQIGLQLVGNAQFFTAAALLTAAALVARGRPTRPDRADAAPSSAEPVLAGAR